MSEINHQFISLTGRNKSKKVTVLNINLAKRPDLIPNQNLLDQNITNLPYIPIQNVKNNINNTLRIAHSVKTLYAIISETTIKIGVLHDGKFITFLTMVRGTYRNMHIRPNNSGIIVIRLLVLDGYQVEQKAFEKIKAVINSLDNTHEYFSFVYKSSADFGQLVTLFIELGKLQKTGMFYNHGIGLDNAALVSSAHSARNVKHHNHSSSSCFMPGGYSNDQLQYVAESSYVACFNGQGTNTAEVVLKIEGVIDLLSRCGNAIGIGGNLEAAFNTMVDLVHREAANNGGQDLMSAKGFPTADLFIKDGVGAVGGGIGIGGGAGGGGSGGSGGPNG